MMVLEDQLPEQNASRPKLLDPGLIAHKKRQASKRPSGRRFE
jgi:hypothetical protein